VSAQVRGGEGEVLLCRRRHGHFAVQSGDETDVAESCASVEPVTRGTRIAAEIPRGTGIDHLLIRLTPGDAGEMAYCGLDITYRAGARLGLERGAGGYYGVWWPEGSPAALRLMTKDELDDFPYDHEGQLVPEVEGC
jgi:hypothetical protein